MSTLQSARQVALQVLRFADPQPFYDAIKRGEVTAYRPNERLMYVDPKEALRWLESKRTDLTPND